MIRSPQNLRDPTMTKTLRESYASGLRRLFRNYKKEIIKRFDDNSRELETDVNMPAMSVYVEDIAESTILIPGRNIVDDKVLNIYKAGIAWAGIRVFKTDQQMMPVDWRALDAIKVRNLTALKKITSEMNGQIIREISDGMMLGEHPRIIAKRITSRVDVIGIHRANLMARTETITAFNQAAEIRYSQYGYEKLEWLTAIDDRACDECIGYDGDVFDVTSNHVRPPAHPNCRCTVLPVE